MINGRYFWLWALSSLTGVAIVLAVAIWQSRQPSSPPLVIDKPAKTVTADEVFKPVEPASQPKPSTQPLAANAPAPAKKLHQLLNDSDLPSPVDGDLEQRIQKLDRQLAELHEQLQARGIAIPDNAAEQPPSVSETQTRLHAIRSHMADRDQN